VPGNTDAVGLVVWIPVDSMLSAIPVQETKAGQQTIWAQAITAQPAQGTSGI
jgi:hypothetical protein